MQLRLPVGFRDPGLPASEAWVWGRNQYLGRPWRSSPCTKLTANRVLNHTDELLAKRRGQEEQRKVGAGCVVSKRDVHATAVIEDER